MARHAGPVLVDTNVIFEASRIGAWRALSSGYALETVEDCVTETQTGFQRRSAEQKIDAGKLRSSLRKVHSVGDRHLAALALDPRRPGPPSALLPAYEFAPRNDDRGDYQPPLAR